MNHGRSWSAVLAVVVVLVGGCGVPLNDSANAVPANLLPVPPAASVPSPSPAASTNAGSTPSAAVPQSRLRLWFVQEDGLAAVESDLPVGSPAQAVIASLALGPEPDTTDEGLRTIATDPLTGESLVAVVTDDSTPESPLDGADASASPTDSTVIVRLSPAFSALPSTEQVLLLGQVVLSLTGSGAGSVAFTDDAGTSVGVPLPDGRLLDVPATARDYNALIVRP